MSHLSITADIASLSTDLSFPYARVCDVDHDIYLTVDTAGVDAVFDIDFLTAFADPTFQAWFIANHAALRKIAETKVGIRSRSEFTHGGFTLSFAPMGADMTTYTLRDASGACVDTANAYASDAPADWARMTNRMQDSDFNPGALFD